MINPRDYIEETLQEHLAMELFTRARNMGLTCSLEKIDKDVPFATLKIWLPKVIADFDQISGFLLI